MKTSIAVFRAFQTALLSLSLYAAGGLPDAAYGQPPESAMTAIPPNSADGPPRGSTRAIRAVRAQRPPHIDGQLSEPAWQTVGFSGDFWMTDQRRWPTEVTEVAVLADDDALYIAFRAHDSRPDGIQSIETVRDRGLGFDDQVAVEIDAFGDHGGTSAFKVNSRGTQDDTIASGRATNIQWKGDWTAAVAHSDTGWTAEIAIPFSILNYRTAQTSLLINFARYHHRTRQWSRWADVTPQNKKEEMGRLLDIRLPNRTDTTNWTIMPYLLVGKDIPDRKSTVQDRLTTGGVDIRYAPRSNITSLLTINPDFAQVEKQITDANFSYTEKRVPDARVFFREGAEYYGDNERIFYSPRVPDFDAGAKVFGQGGMLRYSAFAAAAPNDRTDGLLRLSLAPSATHAVTLTSVATDREDFAGTTTAISAKGRERVGSYWSVDLIESQNEAFSVRDDGAMGEVEAGWQGDYFRAGIGYDKYDALFLPADGLIKRDRLGTNRRSAYMSYYRSFGSAAISETTIDVVGSLRRTRDGRTQDRNWYVGTGVEWKEFLLTTVAFSQSDYRPASVLAPGLFEDHLNDDRFWTLSLDFNTRSNRFGYGVSASSGDLGGGDYGYGVAYFWTRPSAGTSLSFTAERLESFGITEQYVAEAGWDITDTNSLVFRYVWFDAQLSGQFDAQLDIGDQQYQRVGYRRVVRDGLDIFVLYDREPMAEAELSLKLLWTF